MTSIPKRRKARRKRSQKKHPQHLGTTKLLIILVGNTLIFYGILIGHLEFKDISIPAYFIIGLGLSIELLMIVTFVVKKSTNTNYG